MSSTDPPQSQHGATTSTATPSVCDVCGAAVNYFLWHVGKRVVNQPCGHVSRWSIK